MSPIARVRMLLPVVALLLSGLARAEVVKLENPLVTVSVDSQTGAMTVLDKRNGYLWQPGSAEAATARMTIRHALVPVGPGMDRPGDPTVILTSDMVAEATGKAAVSAKAWVNWEDTGLHLSVAVKDAKLVLGSPTETQWWEKDGIEFWIGARQYGVRLFDGGANVWSSAGEVKGAKASWKATADGYALDVFIPAAEAPGETFQQGKSFRFALGINDAGASGKREAQLYYPQGWQHSNTNTFAVATLGDAAGAVAATGPAALPEVLRDLKLAADGHSLTFGANIGDGKEVPGQVRLTLAPDAAEVVAEVDTPDHQAKIGNFRLFKPLVLDDPNGFIFYAPYCDGIAVPVNLLSWRNKGVHCASTDLPWVGVSDGKKGYMVLLEDPDDAGWVLDAAKTAKGTLLCPSIYHGESKRVFGYARRMRYTFFSDGGYVAACKRYRQFAKEHGFLRPLKSRLAMKPELAKLPGAPDVWGAPGLKFAREAKTAGFERMLINFTGPRADIEAMKRLGYLVSEYDNYCDINGPGPGQYNDVKIEDDSGIAPDGQPMKGWLTWDKKHQYYERCPALAEAAARKWIPVDLKDHPRNARFLDVTTARGLFECWSKVHPITRTGDREASRRLAKFVGDDLKLVLGGEHGRWWGADIYDYWEGMQSGGFYSWPAGHVDVNIPEKREEIGFCNLDPEIHGVGNDKFGALHLVEYMDLERRRNVGQQHIRQIPVGFRQRGIERLEHAQFREQRPAIVHVHLIFARPMEGLARQDLQAGQVNLMALIELEVLLGKVFTHHAHQAHGAEKARRHAGVTGGTAQQSRIFRRRRFNGIKGGGTNNENAHGTSYRDSGLVSCGLNGKNGVSQI